MLDRVILSSEDAENEMEFQVDCKEAGAATGLLHVLHDEAFPAFATVRARGNVKVICRYAGGRPWVGHRVWKNITVSSPHLVLAGAAVYSAQLTSKSTQKRWEVGLLLYIFEWFALFLGSIHSLRTLQGDRAFSGCSAF